MFKTVDHCHIPTNAVLSYLLLSDTISNYENACVLCGNRKNTRRLLLFSKSHFILFVKNYGSLYIYYKHNNIMMYSTDVYCVSAMCSHRKHSSDL